MKGGSSKNIGACADKGNNDMHGQKIKLWELTASAASTSSAG
jgi:hypothetical protein